MGTTIYLRHQATHNGCLLACFLASQSPPPSLSLSLSLSLQETLAGVAVVLDLHLNDDSVSSQQMALKDVNENGIATASAIDFWDR